MNSSVVQLLVLAGIAIFLILRLKSVLGTRDGFEKPPVPRGSNGTSSANEPQFEVIEGGPDRDIVDNVPEESPQAVTLAKMKAAEPSFSVSEFLSGAKGAYEMILMGFERGDIASLKSFVSAEVFESFEAGIAMREEQGLTIAAEFVGVRETSLVDAQYDDVSGEGEVTVRFVGEMTSTVTNAEGDVVEGSPNEIKRQKDVWTFARIMGSDDPNWKLVATGE